MSKRTRKPQGPDNKPSVYIALPGSHENFYGAHIRAANVGPRRELTLLVETWSKNSVFFGGGEVIRLRFGALFNFEEVKEFFARPLNESLHYLRYAPESNERLHVIEMEFDRTEDRIKIVAGKVSVRQVLPRC